MPTPPPSVPARDWAITRRLATGLARRGVQLRAGEFALLEGASGSVAVLAMILWTQATHRPGDIWGAYAAFWACLADNRRDVASRLRAMALFVVGGAILATAITAMVDSGLSLTAPLAALTIALRAVNYTMFVGCVTPLFVVITKIAIPLQSAAAPQARAVDTIVGTSIALAICTLIAGIVRWIEIIRPPAPSAGHPQAPV